MQYSKGPFGTEEFWRENGGLQFLKAKPKRGSIHRKYDSYSYDQQAPGQFEEPPSSTKSIL